jgi:hypothetical protein
MKAFQQVLLYVDEEEPATPRPQVKKATSPRRQTADAQQPSFIWECAECKDTGRMPYPKGWCNCLAGHAAERDYLETNVHFLTSGNASLRGMARAMKLNLA